MTFPRIAIWSTFRDDSQNVIPYYERILELDYPQSLLRLYLVEGDSVDDTHQLLKDIETYDYRLSVVKHDTGQPRYSSVIDTERFRLLAKVNNVALNAIVRHKWAEIAVLIESDLIYQPDLLRRLLNSRPDPKAFISPMIWLDMKGWYGFYDIWAYRLLRGDAFPTGSREWYGEHFPQVVFEVESTGSVIMLPMQALIDGCRYDDEAVRGFCISGRMKGYQIYVDPNIHVIHPVREK